MVAGLGRVSPEIGPDTKHRYFTVTTGPSRLTPQLHSEPPGQLFFGIKKKFASFLEVLVFNDLGWPSQGGKFRISCNFCSPPLMGLLDIGLFVVVK